MKKFVFQRERKFQGMDWTPCGLQGDGTGPLWSPGGWNCLCGLQGDGTVSLWTPWEWIGPLWTPRGWTGPPVDYRGNNVNPPQNIAKIEKS